MLKQQLQIKLSQKLSPQQIQLMKLIQLSTLDLEQRIQSEIGENPALENGKELNENEIENIGLLEILYGKNLCFIEWPEKIHNFLPNNYVKIDINIENNLRELGFGDVSVNKKMKEMNKIFYDILLKINDGIEPSFKANKMLLNKYLSDDNSLFIVNLDTDYIVKASLEKTPGLPKSF